MKYDIMETGTRVRLVKAAGAQLLHLLVGCFSAGLRCLPTNPRSTKKNDWFWSNRNYISGSV